MRGDLMAVIIVLFRLLGLGWGRGFTWFFGSLVGARICPKLFKITLPKHCQNRPKTVPEPAQTTPKRPATTPHASHATTHTSTAAMGCGGGSLGCGLGWFGGCFGYIWEGFGQAILDHFGGFRALTKATQKGCLPPTRTPGFPPGGPTREPGGSSWRELQQCNAMGGEASPHPRRSIALCQKRQVAHLLRGW